VPLVWLSPLAREQAEVPGQAVRGGVPVCFPWFGRRHGMPAHGFARNRDWHLADRSPDRVVFTLDDDDETRALWPHRFHAELALHLDDAINFDFTVTNRDDAATPSRTRCVPL
jgi:glucose-6-phosphate 1-epimerase